MNGYLSFVLHGHLPYYGRHKNAIIMIKEKS